ncbi:hypothetical protein Clacol_007869 [Clathrus columnatus]|uniref:Golgi apparatus membrane protein TVP38 n=1 Tax=Clathrus columnatus TaxID=1419009 RepID=A0AAV5AKJ8_9AGAM|nr:hypothetical protein Clacol_007869 [Clathrus columnatus]
MSTIPQPPTYPDHYQASNELGSDPVNRYNITRTPSPTPSEVRALTNHIVDYKRYLHWRFWAKKEWIKYYIISAVILVITILISVYDKQIVKWLTPAGNWMRNVFKYLCRGRAEKAEKSSIFYGCLAQIVRDGGFKMALLIRLSVIPGHFSTAVFSTCGMSVWIFALAAFFSLPKQFITVYIGVILEESGTGTETPRDKIISDSVLGVTILITAAAMWYIFKEMERVKPIVIHNRRKARQLSTQDPSVTLLNQGRGGFATSEQDVVAPLPKRISTQLGHILHPGKEQQRRGSGANMGYGGYLPTFTRYGEPPDDVYERFGLRKSMDDAEWDPRAPPQTAVAVNLRPGKDLEGSSNGNPSQTSLLAAGQRDPSPPRKWTPERYTSSPDGMGIGQPIQKSSSRPPPPTQTHSYPPGLGFGMPPVTSPNSNAPPQSMLPQQQQPMPPPPPQQQQQSSTTTTTTYPAPPYPPPPQQQDRRAFQLSDPPVSRPPQWTSHVQEPSDDSTNLPYARYQMEPSISSLDDRPLNNPYDSAYAYPSSQYPLYPPSHTAYASTTTTTSTNPGLGQGGQGHGIQPSTSGFSISSSDQSYSEHTSLNPRP